MGKDETVLFRFTVAVLMVLMAATIAAPSARALENRSARGSREMCILRTLSRLEWEMDGRWVR